MKLNFHLASFARSVTPIWARCVIFKSSLQAMLCSCNPAFIHFAFPDLWLLFGRFIWYSISPSLPQSNSFLAAFRFFLQPFLLSLVFFSLPMSTSFPALRSLFSTLSTLHCLRSSRSSYPVLCPRLLCLTTSLVILAFVPPFSGVWMVSTVDCQGLLGPIPRKWWSWWSESRQ